jgi:transposase
LQNNDRKNLAPKNEPYLLALMILQAQAKGKTSREISKIVKKSQRTVQLFLSRYENYQGRPGAQEFLETAFMRGRPPTLSFSEKLVLREEILITPTISLDQVIRICQDKFRKKIGKSTAKVLREYAI